MRLIKWLIKALAKQNISLNHVFVAAVTCAALMHGDYLGAGVVWVVGVAYCTLMEKLADNQIYPKT